jgi:hypothetical protein
MDRCAGSKPAGNNVWHEASAAKYCGEFSLRKVTLFPLLVGFWYWVRPWLRMQDPYRSRAAVCDDVVALVVDVVDVVEPTTATPPPLPPHAAATSPTATSESRTRAL